MRLKLIRRFYIIRLAISLVIDYRKIRKIENSLRGDTREAAIDEIHKQAGIRMRNTASKLKGIIVKIGQFLSMRHDILPPAFTNESQELQDALPPAPTAEIMNLLEKELAGKVHTVFLQFDPQALAAASLAQVHKAVLTDGTVVAVKILRPNMEKLAQIDLSTIRLVAKVVQKVPALSRKLNFIDMHQEFKETIEKELNCQQEIKHMKRFEHMFSPNEQIKIPKVYGELSTQRILVMEYIKGTRITDKQLLTEWNINPELTAEIILNAYFKQLLIYGYIHVDPHPGNLLILPDHRLCLLDYGMIDELTPNEIQTLRSLLQNIMFRNQDGIVTAFKTLGFLPINVDQQELTPLLAEALKRLDRAIQHPSKREFKHVVTSLQYFIKKSPIQLQAKYMFLLRCIGMLITVLSQLSPRTNWFEILFRVGPKTLSTPIHRTDDSAAISAYKE